MKIEYLLLAGAAAVAAYLVIKANKTASSVSATAQSVSARKGDTAIQEIPLYLQQRNSASDLVYMSGNGAAGMYGMSYNGEGLIEV